MLNRLLQDEEFKKLDKKGVKRVFILTGTNYVDSVCSNLISLKTATEGIDRILSILWGMFIGARISVINILPRNGYNKNVVIDELNRFISNTCSSHGLNYIDLEHTNRLFTSRVTGLRKQVFFKKGIDNVHLNIKGIARLAKHLKYLSHNEQT